MANEFIIRKGFISKADSLVQGRITADTIVKTGGTSTQFLKADGSIDITVYQSVSEADGKYLLRTTDTLTGDLTVTGTVDANIFTSQNQATNPSELVRFDQMTSYANNIVWKHPIEGQIDFTTSEPGSPTLDDRYINTATGTSSGTSTPVTANNIYQWNGAAWDEYVSQEGWTLWDRDVDSYFTFNVDWINIGGVINHASLDNLQGGNPTERYHLTSAEHAAVAYKNQDNNFSVGQSITGASDIVHNVQDTTVGLNLYRTQGIGGIGLLLRTAHNSNNDRYHIVARNANTGDNFTLDHAGNITTLGDVTAGNFIGDGSQITNIAQVNLPSSIAYTNNANNFSVGQVMNEGLEVNSTTYENIVYTIDFNDGTLGSLVNDPANNADWVIAPAEGVAGTNCMKSVLSGTWKECLATLAFTPIGIYTKLKFKYKQTMEGYPWDSLRVLVNGVELFHGENTTTWTDVEIIIPGSDPGIITFRNYMDGGSNQSPDTVWIDDIHILDLPVNFVSNTSSLFAGLATYTENAVFNSNIVAEGTTYLRDLVVDSDITNIFGSLKVTADYYYNDGGGRYVGVQASTGNTAINLVGGQSVSLFSGSSKITTSTITDSTSKASMDIRIGAYDDQSLYQWSNATDLEPYATMGLSKGGHYHIWFSAQPKELAASMINSRLQVGHTRLTPNQENMNTLDVNGNIVGVGTVDCVTGDSLSELYTNSSGSGLWLTTNAGVKFANIKSYGGSEILGDMTFGGKIYAKDTSSVQLVLERNSGYSNTSIQFKQGDTEQISYLGVNAVGDLAFNTTADLTSSKFMVSRSGSGSFKGGLNVAGSIIGRVQLVLTSTDTASPGGFANYINNFNSYAGLLLKPTGTSGGRFIVGHNSSGSQVFEIGSTGDITTLGSVNAGLYRSSRVDGEIYIQAKTTGDRVRFGDETGVRLDLLANGDLNLLTGKYLLNDEDINTAGTLTNVAYKNQNNNFTVTQSVNGDVSVTRGISFTGADTDFLLYSNTGSSPIYMRDITNGAMITTWGESYFNVAKTLTLSSVDSGTSSVSLMLNGTTVEKRTLGDNAFSSTPIPTGNFAYTDVANTFTEKQTFPNLDISNLQYNNKSISVLVQDEVLGDELFLGTDLQSDEDWSMSNSWIVADGVATCTHPTGSGYEYIIQSVVEVGKTYKVSVDILSNNGSVLLILNDWNGSNFINRQSYTGECVTWEFTATTGTIGFYFTGAQGSVCKISKPTVREVVSSTNAIQKRVLGSAAFEDSGNIAYLDKSNTFTKGQKIDLGSETTSVLHLTSAGVYTAIGALNGIYFHLNTEATGGFYFYDNVTSGGDIIAETGFVQAAELRIGSKSINTSGTLSNVAYKDVNNYFTASQNILGRGNFVYASDGSSVTIEGYGFDMDRGTSYIRPRNHNTQILSIGQNTKTWDNIIYNAITHRWLNDETEFMRLDTNGNLGIGTINPAENLTLNNSSTTSFSQTKLGFYNAYNHSDVRNWVIASDMYSYGAFGISTSSAIGGVPDITRFLIDKLGNVGIGTTTPKTTLNVTGIVSVNAGGEFRMYNAAGNGWASISYNEGDNRAQFQRGIQNSGKTFILNTDGTGIFSGTVSGAEAVNDTDFVTKQQLENTIIEVVDVTPKNLSWGESYVANHRSRILDDGGTWFPNSAGYEIGKLHQVGAKPSLHILPIANKAGTAYTMSKDRGSDGTIVRDCVASYIDEYGALQWAEPHELRIDYTNGDGIILIEGERTNLVLTSSSGYMANPPGSINYYPSIDGLLEAVAPIPDSGADRFQYTIPGGTYADGTVLTYSWYTRRLSTPVSSVYVGDLSITGYINGAPKSVVQIASNIQGFNRYSVNFTVADGSIDSIFRAYFGSIIGVGNESVIYWGHQFELGTAATSYMKTEGTTFTRFKDEVDNLGDANSFNDEEGVICFKSHFFTSDPESYDRAVMLHGSNGNIQVRTFPGGSSYQILIYIDSTYVVLTTQGNILTTEEVTIAYETDNVRVYIDGSLVYTDTDCEMVSGLNKLEIQDGWKTSFIRIYKSIAEAQKDLKYIQ